MASSHVRWVAVALVLGLVFSFASVPRVGADSQVEDFEDEGDAGQGEAGSKFDEGAAEDGTTEVVKSGDEYADEDATPALESAPGVHTSAIFPAFLGKSPVLRAGQVAEILFGISNEGSSPLKISGILGRLSVTYDYNIVAQNFTGDLPSNVTFVNATVPTGAQSSFAFHLTPFRLLQPMTFGLAVSVFYEAGGSPHASVLFNSTVEVVEPAGVVSGETVFLVLLGAGVLALVFMWASSQIENLSKRAKRSKKVETGTGEDSDASANEWLQGTFFNAKQGKPGQAAKQRRRR